MPPPPQDNPRKIPMGAIGNYHLNASKISELLKSGQLIMEGFDDDEESLEPTATTVKIQTQQAFKFIPLTDSTPNRTSIPPKEVTFKWNENNEVKTENKSERKKKSHQGHFNRFNRLMQKLKERQQKKGDLRRVTIPTTTMETIVYSTFRPTRSRTPEEVVESTIETTATNKITSTTPTTTSLTTTTTATTAATSSTTLIKTITESTTTIQEPDQNFDYSKNRPFEPSSGSGEYEYYYEYYYDDGDFEDITIRPIIQ